MVMLNPLPIPLIKIICTQIRVGFLRPQYVVNHDQHFVGQGCNCFVLAPPPSYPMIES
jgi:hypothetical protein